MDQVLPASEVSALLSLKATELSDETVAKLVAFYRQDRKNYALKEQSKATKATKEPKEPKEPKKTKGATTQVDLNSLFGLD